MDHCHGSWFVEQNKLELGGLSYIIGYIVTCLESDALDYKFRPPWLWSRSLCVAVVECWYRDWTCFWGTKWNSLQTLGLGKAIGSRWDLSFLMDALMLMKQN